MGRTLSVFFDLETTDICFMGQILNYAFVVVDDAWEIVDECSGLIRLSRLQLPSAGALIANRTDIRLHQETATDSEKDASKKIAAFLKSVLDRSDKDVRLVGFNSAKFDLPFLRTTLIRNGVDPYLSGQGGRTKLVHGDLMLAAQKLLTSVEEFSIITIAEEKESLKRRLTLQHLCTQFGILKGAQSHESRDDVLLTIALAQVLHRKFGLDIRSWRSYEAGPVHDAPRGTVFLSLRAEYDLSKGSPFQALPVTLLDVSGNSALWIDLLEFDAGKGRSSVFYRNCIDGPLFLTEPGTEVRNRYQSVSKRALESLSGITTKNFFKTTVCDIEADIYRLDFADRDALAGAIWGGVKTTFRSPDAKEVYRRHRLSEFDWGSGADSEASKALAAYAEYRYGGKAIVQKTFQPGTDEVPSSGGRAHLHPTLDFLYRDITERLSSAGPEDAVILSSLKEYYEQSEIVRCLKDNGSPLSLNIS